MHNIPRSLTLLVIITFLAITITLSLAIFYMPVEVHMGLVQKVFYIHLASTWIGMLGFSLATAASIGYLSTRDIRWDHAAISGIEIGMVFVGLGIITGSIWARPIWNTWWTWDPRLTTTLIMEGIYVVYFLLRGNLIQPTQQARIAAIYGIAGFASVPITFLSIRLFRSIHPVLIGNSASSSDLFAMTDRMEVILISTLLLFSIFFVFLFWQRYKLARVEHEIEEIHSSNRNVEE
jgi:heme exporter protein C